MKAVTGVIAFGLLLMCGVAAFELSPSAAGKMAVVSPSVLVSELKLTPGTMDETLTAYGSIQPDAGGETSLAPQASGILGGVAVTPGQRVAAGQELATLNPDAASIADSQRAASAMAAAKANVAHVSALLASHLATDSDLATAVQAASDAQAALAAIRTTGAGRPRALNAPFAGIITAVLATPGTAFTAGTPLIRIADTAHLVASVGLPQSQASQVKAGDTAKLTLLDTSGSLSGTVAGIGTMLDPQTGLTALQIALAAPANAMLNQPVEAVIVAQTLPGFVVPRDAVQTDDAGDFVYQVDADDIAHRMTVRVFVKGAKQTLIAADISLNLPIVISGAPQLADGMAVRTSP